MRESTAGRRQARGCGLRMHFLASGNPIGWEPKEEVVFHVASLVGDAQYARQPAIRVSRPPGSAELDAPKQRDRKCVRPKKKLARRRRSHFTMMIAVTKIAPGAPIR